MTSEGHFRQEGEKYRKIAEAGGWQAYFDRIPEKQRKEALRPASDGYLLCCTNEKLAIDRPCVCAEGSLLISEWGDALRFCQDSGVTAIVSHAGCTAASILWRRVSAKISPRGGELDKFCDEETAKLAERLGVAYEGQVGADRLLGGDSPSHLARTAYYVGVDGFNPRVAPDLPLGAVVTRKRREPINALADLGLVLSNAFGPDGYGDLLTAKDPLTVVTVGGRGGFTSAELAGEVGRLVRAQLGQVTISQMTI